MTTTLLRMFVAIVITTCLVHGTVQFANAQQGTWTKVAAIDNIGVLRADCANAHDCMLIVDTGFRQEVWRSIDGGYTWTVPYADSIDDRPRTPLQLNRIQHPIPDLVLIAADSGYVLRSTDAGISWSRILVGASDNRGERLSMYDAQYGIVAFAGVGTPIAVTSDGGATWQKVSIKQPDGWDGISSYPQDVVCTGPDSYMAVIPGPQQVAALARTTDAGNHWTVSHPLVPERDTLVVTRCLFAPVDRENIFISMNRYAANGIGAFLLIRSSDAGVTWRIVYEPLGGMPANLGQVSFRDTSIGIAAGLQSVYDTETGGRSWEPDTADVADLSEVFFRRGHPGLAVSRFRGTVFVRTEGPSGAVRAIASGGSISVDNSSADQWRIISSFPEAVAASVIVYNYRGEPVLARAVTLPGNSHHTLDVGDFPAGMYMLNIHADGRSHSFKVVLLR